jgi:ribulose-phosphate 3-epimerase
MTVVPVINCPDAACVEKTIGCAQKFLHSGDWVHLDVTDGVFSTHETWHDPAAWTAMKIPFNFEVHLMVAHPEDYVTSWCAAGAKRIIVHVETMTSESARDILAVCREKGAEVMLASNPGTPIEALKPYFDLFSEFLVLAVHPGPAGQSFNPSVLEKIKALRREGAIIIEADGGMNPLTAKLAKDAGANAVASGAYILNASDPKKAYGELREL